MADKLDDLVTAFKGEVKTKRAELQALTAQVSALQQTKRELENQCVELQTQVANWRREYDAQKVARQFVQFCEQRLDAAAAHVAPK